jgi:hypothetical protein
LYGNFFQDFPKVLVCGGYEKSNCEVINLKSSAITCKDPPKLPVEVQRAVGGLGLKENPIICAGEQNFAYSDKCYSLENNTWISFVSLNSVRSGAAGAQLQEGKILVTGGLKYENKTETYLNSTEMLTGQGWESKIPSLPINISFHCIVNVNSTTVMVIGGSQNGDQYSGKTFYFTFGDKSWTEGPALKYKRRGHGCGQIRRDKESQKMSTIVAGGRDGSTRLSSD